MKRLRRLLSALLCLALLLALAPAAYSTADITFLAVNDTIPIALSSATMPFYANSLLYIPLSLFDVDTLGVVPLYDSASRTLTLFNDARALHFDLDEGTMTNENGTIFSAQVISRGGQLFVPALYCAYHFGLSVSFLTSIGGYSVVRFTTGSQVYDDELFIEKANNLIEYRAAQYLESVLPSGSGTQPEPDAPDDPEKEPDDEPEKEPAVLFLAVTGAENMAEALRAFEAAGLRGAFFFTHDEIALHIELILRLYGGGHTVGLIADGQEASANDDLARILHTRAVCTLVLPGQHAPDFGVSFTALGDQQLTLEAALEVEQTPQLFLIDSAAAAQTIAAAQEAGASLLQLRETSPLRGN